MKALLFRGQPVKLPRLYMAGTKGNCMHGSMSSLTPGLLDTPRGMITMRQERLSAEEYIEFLARTDLGSQYPKERFRERIGKLVGNASISLIARNSAGTVVGVCFGLTDFAYWLLITDLGIDRNFTGVGIGSELMRLAREAAGGSRDIVTFAYANEEAVRFYEKIGMERSTDMMEMTGVEWTDFTVGENAE